MPLRFRKNVCALSPTESQYKFEAKLGAHWEHLRSFPMSLNDTWPYLPHWQYLHAQNKEFDVQSFLYLGIGLLTTLFFYRYLILKDKKNEIRKLGGFSIFTAWSFFAKRYDFISANFGSDPSPHFKFNVLHVSPLSQCHWSRLLTVYAAHSSCFTWR